MLTSIIAGAIIGLIAGALTSSDDRRGCLGNIILGLAGSWIGQLLFGDWGPGLLVWPWYRQSLEQYCWWLFLAAVGGLELH